MDRCAPRRPRRRIAATLVAIALATTLRAAPASAGGVCTVSGAGGRPAPAAAAASDAEAGSAARARSSAAVPRLTGFDWHEVDAAAYAADVAGAAAPTPLARLRRALGIEAAERAADARPTLVYVHWPHEAASGPLAAEARATRQLCTRVLDDEASARWGLLFRCVQVDAATADARLLAALDVGAKPGLVVVDATTGTPSFRFPEVATPAKFVKGCQDALAKFPEARRAVDAAIAEQAKALAAARAAVKADRLEDAMAQYERITGSPIRVGPNYDVAQGEAFSLRDRIERAKAKPAR
jgi:hypothetical protein